MRDLLEKIKDCLLVEVTEFRSCLSNCNFLSIYLNICIGKGLGRLFSSLKTLESNVAKERAAFRMQIQKLRSENASLVLRMRQLTEAGGRKPADGSSGLIYHSRPRSVQSRGSNRRRSRSRSSSASGCVKISSLSPGSSLESLRAHRSPCRVTKTRNISNKDSS